MHGCRPALWNTRNPQLMLVLSTSKFLAKFLSSMQQANIHLISLELAGADQLLAWKCGILSRRRQQ